MSITVPEDQERYEIAAQQGESALLLIREGEEKPEKGRVFDIAIRRLYPWYPFQSIMARGYWEEPDWEGDVNELVKGAERVDAVARDSSVDPGAS